MDLDVYLNRKLKGGGFHFVVSFSFFVCHGDEMMAIKTIQIKTNSLVVIVVVTFMYIVGHHFLVPYFIILYVKTSRI